MAHPAVRFHDHEVEAQRQPWQQRAVRQGPTVEQAIRTGSNARALAVIDGLLRESEFTPGTPADLEPDLSQQVRALTIQVSQLTSALDSNRRIGMAMGIIMNQRQVDEAHAFDLLRRISQNTNRKLRDIAEDVIRERRV